MNHGICIQLEYKIPSIQYENDNNIFSVSKFHKLPRKKDAEIVYLCEIVVKQADVRHECRNVLQTNQIANDLAYPTLLGFEKSDGKVKWRFYI